MAKASTTHGQAQRTFRQLVGAFRHSEGCDVLGVLGLMGKHGTSALCFTGRTWMSLQSAFVFCLSPRREVLISL